MSQRRGSLLWLGLLENYYRWAQASGLPHHYFVRDGVVVRQIIGPLQPSDMATIVDELLTSRQIPSLGCDRFYETTTDPLISGWTSQWK